MPADMRAIGLALLLTLALAACRPPSEGGSTGTSGGGLEVIVEAEDEPGLGIFPILVTVRSDGLAVAGARVEVTGDMTHAGMVPVIREAAEVESGVYRADTFEFTMAGDWVVTAEVELTGGESAVGEASFAVPGR